MIERCKKYCYWMGDLDYLWIRHKLKFRSLNPLTLASAELNAFSSIRKSATPKNFPLISAFLKAFEYKIKSLLLRTVNFLLPKTKNRYNKIPITKEQKIITVTWKSAFSHHHRKYILHQNFWIWPHGASITWESARCDLHLFTVTVRTDNRETIHKWIIYKKILFQTEMSLWC